jgi:DNA-binding response OmpR family regulator/nitrogen-specific signal transduction histidine kinase
MRSKPLILNVDDDEAGRYAIGRHLKLAGYEVSEAATGEDGLRLVSELKPDMVLLDVRLPDIDGFEVCRRIREQPSEIASTPVIQLSASYLDTRSKVKGLETGADAYLTEPVEPAILTATIESVLRIRRAEHKIRRAALEWQTTFDAIRDGVALLDPQGAIVRSNQYFRQLAGAEPSPVYDAIRGGMRGLGSNGARQSFEIIFDSKNLQLTIDPVRAGDAVDGAVCVVADVTEKKRFEADLRQTAKLESIGVLAGGIAHDFNNLLTGIMGNSSLLLESFPDRPSERVLVEEILKASESAADLTRQILAYAGKGNFVKVQVDLTRVALDARPFVRRFIPLRVQLVFQTDPNLPAIEGDPGQMQQVVMNLVINAAESFEEGQSGVIAVHTDTRDLDEGFFRGGEKALPGRYVVLTVADTGGGMTEETQRRIFEPFFTTKFAGRGLGLSAVHGILKNHNGYLRLESKPGEGANFSIYLPAASAQPVKAAPDLPRSPGMRGTILLADDESVIRNFARAALQKGGYEVILAEDGGVAVDLFRRFRDLISLVILDFAMPVMSGEEAFEKMRALAPAVPILLSSGFSQSEAAGRFRGGRLAGFLGKPYTAPRLVEAVREALASKDREHHA